MNKEILISATDLKKYFPVHKFMGGKQYVKAVDGVSLEINKGETFGLVGESGCGKSTLERTLIRMYDITDGKVTYKGKDILVSRDNAVKLEKGEYYIADILGAKVILEDGSEFGVLEDVMQTGANDVYVVKTLDNKEVLLPKIDECVKKLDIENKIVTVHIMKGLLD